jgi:hypothetical protein
LLEFPDSFVPLEQGISSGSTHIFRRGLKTWKWEVWSKCKEGTIVTFLVKLQLQLLLPETSHSLYEIIQTVGHQLSWYSVKNLEHKTSSWKWYTDSGVWDSGFSLCTFCERYPVHVASNSMNCGRNVQTPTASLRV